MDPTLGPRWTQPQALIPDVNNDSQPRFIDDVFKELEPICPSGAGEAAAHVVVEGGLHVVDDLSRWRRR